MSVAIEIDHARRRVDVSVRHAVSFDGIARVIRCRAHDGVVSYAMLVDMDGQATDLSPDEVRALVELRRTLYAGTAVGATAVVAERDVTFGMLRMYELLAETRDAETRDAGTRDVGARDAGALYVARTRADAEAWLAQDFPGAAGRTTPAPVVPRA